jgi:hypothetical protein
VKKNINENIRNIKNNGNYYFIKPFDVASSYYSFAETWKIVNRVYKEIDDVSDARLMQSFFDNAKFGYISYSSWKTKEAFIKSNSIYTVLKYHNALNGDSSKFPAHTLYKLISEDIYNKKNKKKKTLEIIIFETDLSKDDNVRVNWKVFCNNLNEKKGINSASLYQAIYKKTKFKYVGIIDRGDYEANHDTLVKPFTINNEEKKNGYKIYSSLYRIVKKYS